MISKNIVIEIIYIIYTAYNRGFPFNALEAISATAPLEYCVFIHDVIIIYYSEYFLPVNNHETNQLDETPAHAKT